MAWFKKKNDGEEKPGGAAKREFDRYVCDGETICFLEDSGDGGPPYLALDISFGGFAIKGYDGNLHGNQYFEFRFTAEKDGEPHLIEGFGSVVRVKDGMLAAKFTPQPRLKNQIRDFIDSK